MIEYPSFSAKSVADGYWEVYHDDDCGAAFDWFGGGVCPKCRFRPDLQSIAGRKTDAWKLLAESAMEKGLSKMEPILEYFQHDHLPAPLQLVAKPICELAKQMDAALPRSAEKAAGLRKLLEAKDCFVRAALPAPAPGDTHICKPSCHNPCLLEK